MRITPNAHKPTATSVVAPNVFTWPSDNFFKSDTTLLAKVETPDTVAWAGPFVLEGGKLDRELTPSGYIKADTAYYFLRDHQGSVRQVVSGADGSVVQENQYYPYGSLHGESSAQALANGASAQPYKYGGKEHITLANAHLLDFTARTYDPALGLFHQPDPLREKHYGIDSRVYCIGNPVCFADPTGCDTTNVCYSDGKWNISDPIIAEGDDVFIITMNDETTTITFSEGEYGNRLNMVLLSENEEERFGVYQLSGEKEIGFAVLPKKCPSRKDSKDIVEIPCGTFTTYEGKGKRWYSYVGLNGDGATPGIRVHYGKGSGWSQGCVILSTDYTTNQNGNVSFELDDSREAVWRYVQYLGATKRTKDYPMPTKKRTRDKYDYDSNSRVNNSTFILKNR